VANKVLIEVHGSLVILKMLQMVRRGQVRSGAVNSQTEYCHYCVQGLAVGCKIPHIFVFCSWQLLIDCYTYSFIDVS